MCSAITIRAMVLTAGRLAKLAQWEGLKDKWFLIATVTLTVCNQPQEIPKLYHYALNVKHLNAKADNDLYSKVDNILKKYAEIKALGTDLNYSPYDPNLKQEMFKTTDKFRESILKTAALSGLPKCINSMMQLKDNTPVNLRSSVANRKPIKSWEDYVEMQERGKKYWDGVYTKISRRVESQMASSYPDLWKYTIDDVYSPLLSYTDVLTPEETSLVVISSLIPQDVNPQLKGHLKGALNGGVAIETLRETREMAIVVSKWCDNKYVVNEKGVASI